jgi:hypothetical protein
MRSNGIQFAYISPYATHCAFQRFCSHQRIYLTVRHRCLRVSQQVFVSQSPSKSVSYHAQRAPATSDVIQNARTGTVVDLADGTCRPLFSPSSPCSNASTLQGALTTVRSGVLVFARGLTELSTNLKGLLFKAGSNFPAQARSHITSCGSLSP